MITSDAAGPRLVKAAEMTTATSISWMARARSPACSRIVSRRFTTGPLSRPKDLSVVSSRSAGSSPLSGKSDSGCGLPRLSRSPDVNMGPAVPIGFGTAYHLAGHGRDFSYTEDQEANQVRCRIAFGPFEVDVRQPVGAVPHGQQQGGKRVRDGRAAQSEDPVAAMSSLAGHVEVTGEFRRVRNGDLDEDHVVRIS